MWSFLIFFAFQSSNVLSATPIASVPKVFLEYWNEDSDLQYSNNCYNYATNRVTNSYAQPGEASDKMYTELSCEDVHKAASLDLGLTPTEFFPYGKKEDKTLIALVVAPGYDFHWYRRDDDGFWTHKMGGTPATTLDDGGQPISSPETADRGLYTDFCGYFQIANFALEEHEQNGGHVRIGDMTELPGEISEVQILLYSGRRNPSYPLKDLLERKELKAAFLKIQNELTNIQSNSLLAVRKTPHAKLGYQGIQIFDREGLIAEKGSIIRFKDGMVFTYSEGDKNPLTFESKAFESLEKRILRL